MPRSSLHGAIPLSVAATAASRCRFCALSPRLAPWASSISTPIPNTNDTLFGDNPYTHGTPFRRAIEEGLLDPKRIVQIGIRGSVYEPSEHD